MPKAAFSADFWCYSDAPLDELFSRFRESFPVDEAGFVHDSENVWEWFGGLTADQSIGFNITRPHEDVDEFGLERRPIPNTPVVFRLLLDGSEAFVDVGQRLSGALGIEVHYGKVTYVRGDEFKFEVEQSFPPPQRLSV